MPRSSKPDTGFGGRGIAKAFKDAGIGINSKLGVKKTDVSSGSLSRDVSDDGDSLLKRQPIIAEKCMQLFFHFSFAYLLVLHLHMYVSFERHVFRSSLQL